MDIQSGTRPQSLVSLLYGVWSFSGGLSVRPSFVLHCHITRLPNQSLRPDPPVSSWGWGRGGTGSGSYRRLWPQASYRGHLSVHQKDRS